MLSWLWSWFSDGKVEPKDIIALVALFVSLSTFALNWRYQRKTKQLESLLKVHEILIDRLDDIEDLYKFKDIPYSEWKPEVEIKKVRDICGAFHLVGILSEQGLVPGRLLARMWYYSIPKTYEALTPFWADIREKRGPKYWHGFDHLLSYVEDNSFEREIGNKRDAWLKKWDRHTKLIPKMKALGNRYRRVKRVGRGLMRL